VNGMQPFFLRMPFSEANGSSHAVSPTRHAWGDHVESGELDFDKVGVRLDLAYDVSAR
jgi:hypothetical protein